LPLEHERREVYAFDQVKANVLNSIPPSTPGEDLKVFSYVRDPWYKVVASHQFWLDSTLLGLSVVAKLAEVFVQWTYGAHVLALITFMIWVFFFIAAMVLHLHGMRRHRPASEIDTVAGSLPTCSTVGGSRKVLLGIPRARRQHFLWKIVWAVGAIAGVFAVISTYLALGRSESAQVFFIWAGFQILWLGSRSAIYYVLSDREMQYQVSVEGKPWSKVNPQERARVSNLVFALSKYLQHMHPRSILSYLDDVDTISSSDWRPPEKVLSYSLPCSNETTVEISVASDVGDTLLAGVAWIFGSKRGGFDFYDTCVIILNIVDGTIAVPAARVLSGKPPLQRTDSEWGVQASHLPRGGVLPQGNRSLPYTEDLRWCYWVPCSNGNWLYFTTPATKTTGTREASIWTDQQVTDTLARGELWVSLKHVDEVKDIIENSALAYDYLLQLFS
jgi:hypothetical protein